jgi:hypothetical protein
MMSAVAQHDTEPESEKTQPDPQSGEGRTARDARALLEGVSDAAAADGVRETNGHTAAAYAVPAHKPPKAHETGTFPDAVVINATAPLAAPLPLAGPPQATPPPGAAVPAAASGPLRSERDIKTFVNPRPRSGDAANITVPSMRVKRARSTAIIVGFGVGILVTGIVAFALAIGGGDKARPVADPTGNVTATANAKAVGAATAVETVAATAAALAPATVTATAPATATASATAPATAPATVTATAPATAIATVAPATPQATGAAAAGKPEKHPAASAAPKATAPPGTAKTGKFVEPDRTF